MILKRIVENGYQGIVGTESQASPRRKWVVRSELANFTNAGRDDRLDGGPAQLRRDPVPGSLGQQLQRTPAHARQSFRPGLLEQGLPQAILRFIAFLFHDLFLLLDLFVGGQQLFAPVLRFLFLLLGLFVSRAQAVTERQPDAQEGDDGCQADDGKSGGGGAAADPLDQPFDAAGPAGRNRFAAQVALQVLGQGGG